MKTWVRGGWRRGRQARRSTLVVRRVALKPEMKPWRRAAGRHLVVLAGVVAMVLVAIWDDESVPARHYTAKEGQTTPTMRGRTTYRHIPFVVRATAGVSKHPVVTKKPKYTRSTVVRHTDRHTKRAKHRSVALRSVAKPVPAHAPQFVNHASLDEFFGDDSFSPEIRRNKIEDPGFMDSESEIAEFEKSFKQYKAASKDLAGSLHREENEFKEKKEYATVGRHAPWHPEITCPLAENLLSEMVLEQMGRLPTTTGWEGNSQIHKRTMAWRAYSQCNGLPW